MPIVGCPCSSGECSIPTSMKAALVRSTTKGGNTGGELGREALEDGFSSRYDLNTVFSCIKLPKNR